MHFVVVVSKGFEFFFWGWSLNECYECLRSQECGSKCAM
jgi:hypothetical protein